MVAGLKVRDRESIGLFFKIYYNRVYAICASILSQEADARDMAMDILVDFVENRADHLASSKALYAFLRQAAVRRSLRYRERLNKMADMETELSLPNETTPEELANLNMLMPFLKECLGGLRPKVQMSLRLKYTRRISNEQIGKIVGGSKSYIGRLLKQGIKSLKRCIEFKIAQKNIGRGPHVSPFNAALPSVTSFEIEQLLSMRLPLPSDTCEAALRMATVTTDISNPRNMTWAQSHLARCPSCRDYLLYTHAEEGNQGLGKREKRDERHRKTIRTTSMKSLAIAALALIALGIAYFGFVSRGEKTGSATSLTVKGPGDRFFAAVRRGGTEFTLHPGDKLKKNDQIGLFYTARESGYLAVFSKDDNGETVLLYPAGRKRSAPIKTGARIPLNDGAVVEAGDGCAWLIAVFSREALSTARIAESIASAKRTTAAEGCQLSPLLDDARTVRVLPVVHR
jgi:RNA polymerase sigma factor (sigma-70 family)